MIRLPYIRYCVVWQTAGLSQTDRRKSIYAVWQENEYTIEYDTGVSATVKYSDTVTLPSQHMCIGWILGEEYPDIKLYAGREYTGS